ncbi:MAG: 50S ribosomal protein L13 [Candidatus Andersenbacteria bacterium]
MAKSTTKTKKKPVSAPKKVEWHLIDASVDPLGRTATHAAELLLGKHRTDYAAHQIAPVRVVVLNTDKVKVTGKKYDQKMYRRYTGYPGGLRERNMADQMGRDSRVIFQMAVFGMLPKNSLRAHRMKNLLVYPTQEHPHEAQITS